MRPHDDNFGDWQGLASSNDAPRYSAIAEMLRQSNLGRQVLDIGSGEGLLRAWLPSDCVYLGIERSALAIQNAQALNHFASASFVHVDAERFDSHVRQFDSIVFNEMLYYSADPVGLVRKYSALLQPSGGMLCSIFQKAGGVSLRRRLRHFFDRRRPLSNIHCERMVRAYMAREDWRILDDREVGSPERSRRWHIWLARPQRLK